MNKKLIFLGLVILLPVIIISDSAYTIKKERSSIRTSIPRQHCCEAFAKLLKSCPQVRIQLANLQRRTQNISTQRLLADLHDTLSSVELFIQQLVQDFVQGAKKGLWDRPTKERLTIVSTRIASLEKALVNFISFIENNAHRIDMHVSKTAVESKKSTSDVITPQLNDIHTMLKNDLKFFQTN